MTDQRSRLLYDRASRVLVGGVNSPVRAFCSVGGTPRFIVSGKGAHVTDADGNKLVDFVCSWGALLFGHAPDFLHDALERCARYGTSYGFPTELEIEFGEQVRRLAPHVEMLRCVNSGSEATAAAIRLARGVTGRPKILKCAGCYHGAVDSLLVTAGSGIATLGIPETVGIPKAVAGETLVVPYNDREALLHAFQVFGNEIAGFILEPVAGNMGLVPPDDGYLALARQLTSDHGALLIFDEVMTGFRIAAGGAVELYNVVPDIVCFGKILGGGVPIGAIGGRKEVMEQLAPVGPVYQAGTLAGNPLAMSVGLATLQEIERRGQALYEELNQRANRLASGLMEIFLCEDVPAVIQRVGSMFTVFFIDRRVRNYVDAKSADTLRFARFFHAMLEAGVHLPPSQFECWFMGTEHDDEVIEKT
ncbi:MAG: glutamate-1-semialdehyde 2,1-aminomutase, partial [Candidatus Sumerlaeaceae bacterium]|nr:glutamate-1-semialdehyde 2,1-aminomutase [Candidatus Sumerlaeaceae bacterium]